MRRDHRPYAVKKAYQKYQKFYVNRFIRPQLDSLGNHFIFMKPWHVEIFGTPIHIGDYPTFIATQDNKIRLTIWSNEDDIEGIHIGDYCLICPGVRISAATSVTIGDNCMIANGAYITDSDAHDIYDRSYPVGRTRPIKLENNVWIGDSAIVTKGVTIGENSIVGAGAVVVKDIPPNTVAAGNPARVVKELDPAMKFTTRGDWFADPVTLAKKFRKIDKSMLEGNTFLGWFRAALFPRKGD